MLILKLLMYMLPTIVRTVNKYLKVKENPTLIKNLNIFIVLDNECSLNESQKKNIKDLRALWLKLPQQICWNLSDYLIYESI